MKQDLKKAIINAAIGYATANNISNNDVARLSGVNAGYLSALFRHQYSTKVKDVDTPIGDKWFYKLATWCGYSLKKMYWKTLQTRQFMEGISSLESCLHANKTCTIIGETGVGKTKFIDLFLNKHPQYTYRITISSLYKLNDVINELAEKIGVDFNNGVRNSQKVKVDLIIRKLIDINHHSKQIPTVLFDEAENIKMPVLNMLKALYDKVIPYCSIAVVGTEQFLNKLRHMRKNTNDAIPQFARRFKAGTIMLSPINKTEDFKPFYEAFKIEKGLQKLLTQLADNYGELHDYLEPALKYADENGEELTEDRFRLMYNLPKY